MDRLATAGFLILFFAAFASMSAHGSVSPKAEQYYSKGRLLTKQCKYAEALPVLQQANQLDPKSFEIHYELGWTFENLNQAEKALAEYKAALAACPQDDRKNLSDTLDSLAAIYSKLGNLTDAVKFQEQAANIDQKSEKIQYNLGIKYHKVGNNQKALEQYKRALEIKPTYMNAMLAMSDAYLDLAQINSAIDWAQRATKAQPNYPNAHYTLAYAYRQNGESKKAVEEYQQALRLKPNDVEVMKNIAMCYSDQGLKREAVIWYQAYLKANPKAPDFKRTSDLIADLLREIQNQPITEDPQGPDYYLSAMAGESARRWPATSIPIKVYIDPGVNVPSMRDLNLRIIAEAFVEWMVASQGRISFKFLSSPELADITCYWTSNPTEVTSKGTDRQTGSTTTTEGKKDGKWELRKANMKLLTIGKDGKMVDEKSLKCTCLHEVGHALGLGHSPNSHDIMYFQDTPNGANSLTNRDKATLLKFYE